jgi:hypothetical protein
MLLRHICRRGQQGMVCTVLYASVWCNWVVVDAFTCWHASVDFHCAANLPSMLNNRCTSCVRDNACQSPTCTSVSLHAFPIRQLADATSAIMLMLQLTHRNTALHACESAVSSS